MSAILPALPVLESICVELDPRKAQLNIDENIEHDLKNKVFLRCTEKGNYILGGIKTYYRQPNGKVNTLTAEKITTVYTLLYMANSMLIKKDDIIYNAEIIVVTPNEIIFIAKDTHGNTVIRGTVLPNNLPTNFQGIYKAGDFINVKIIESIYNKGQNYVDTTSDICNIFIIGKSFREIEFYQNLLEDLEKQLGKGEKYTNTNIIDGFGDFSAITSTKHGQLFTDFLLANSDIPNFAELSKDQLVYYEILNKIIFMLNADLQFSVSKNINNHAIIAETIKKYGALRGRTHTLVPDASDGLMIVGSPSIGEYTYNAIKTGSFPKNLILKLPINLHTIDSMWIYILTSLYVNVSLFIPEINSLLDSDVYLICIRRVSSSIDYSKLQEYASTSRKMFRTMTRPFEYIDEMLQSFLGNYKRLRKLFIAKHDEISKKYNYKLPSAKPSPTRDPIYNEKEEYTHDYIARHIMAVSVAKTTEAIAEDTYVGGDDESEEYYSSESSGESS
jgi:hypothetical protein